MTARAGSPTRLAIRFAGPADTSKANNPATPQCCYAYELVLGGSKGKPQHVLTETLRWPNVGGRQVRLFERKRDGSIGVGKLFRLRDTNLPSTRFSDRMPA